MNWDDLKLSIGERAKDIIHADKADGIGNLVCFMTAHASNPELDWSSGALHFKCHNCGEYWDILDHAKDQAGGDNKQANEILHEYAGIEMDEPKPKETKPKIIEWEGIQPISRERSREMVQYMQERRISEATLKRYHVTGDSQAIYFNYVCDKTLVKIKGRLIGSHANGRDKYSPTPKGGVNTLYGQHTYKKQYRHVAPMSRSPHPRCRPAPARSAGSRTHSRTSSDTTWLSSSRTTMRPERSSPASYKMSYPTMYGLRPPT